MVGWTPGRWFVCTASGCERGRGLGKRGQAWAGWAGYLGTLGTYLNPTQAVGAKARSLGAVRGKPNELKRLDVPVAVPTSRPPLAIRNESATRAGTASSFYQGWLGSTHLSAYHPDPSTSFPAQVNWFYTRTAIGRAASSQQQHSTPGRAPSIRTSPQTCPASQHNHSLTRLSERQGLSAFILYLHCTHSPWSFLHDR